jgi:hypothetical protein
MGVIAFSILAVTTQNSKMSCPCANPYKQIGYERILDMNECNKVRRARVGLGPSSGPGPKGA